MPKKELFYRALLWVLIVVSTALAWAVGLMIMVGIGFGSAIWDPDEVQSYRRQTPQQRLVEDLVSGFLFGIPVATLVALVRRFVLRRSPLNAVLIAAAAVGISMAMCALSSTGPANLTTEGEVMLRAGLVGGVLAGALAGMCQQVLLETRVGRLDGWTLASIVTWAAMLGILPWVEENSGAVLTPIAVLAGLGLTAAAGATGGMLQWLSLRRRVRRAGWWVAASTLSWVALAAAMVARPFVVDSIFALAALLMAVIQATALVALLPPAVEPADAGASASPAL